MKSCSHPIHFILAISYEITQKFTSCSKTKIRSDNFAEYCQSLREHTSITLAARDEIPHRIKHGFRSSTHPQDIRNSIVAVASSAWPPSGL